MSRGFVFVGQRYATLYIGLFRGAKFLHFPKMYMHLCSAYVVSVISGCTLLRRMWREHLKDIANPSVVNIETYLIIFKKNALLHNSLKYFKHACHYMKKLMRSEK